MANATADYPGDVWDGLSPNTQRVNKKDNVEPDPRDWAKIVEEVRAVQKQQLDDREFSAVNDEGGALVAGNVVYMKTDGKIAKADADGAAALRIPMGITKAGVANGIAVECVYNGRLTLTLAEWDAVGLTAAGLVIGSKYYVADVAGELTATAPATIGDTLFVVGTAISATTLLVRLDDEGLTV